MICAEARAAIVNAQVGEAGDFSPFRTRLVGEQSAPDSEQPDYLTSESRFCPSAALTGRGEAGNCTTVACWPSHSRVSSTISPSGNSRAS